MFSPTAGSKKVLVGGTGNDGGMAMEVWGAAFRMGIRADR